MSLQRVRVGLRGLLLSLSNPRSADRYERLAMQAGGSKTGDRAEGIEAGDVSDDMDRTDGLSELDQKMRLIERDLDAQGMGRYQWCIWLLCGTGYFLDLAWAQLLGLIAVALQREFNVADGDIGNLFVAVNVGLTTGSSRVLLQLRPQVLSPSGSSAT